MSAGSGQAAALVVSRVDTAPLLVDSTGRVTSVLRIENRGGVPRTGRLAVSLPFGWRSLALDSVVIIPARDAEFALIPLWVPFEAMAGTSMVRVSIATDGAADVLHDSVPVTIPVRRRLSLAPEPPPRYVPAGDRYIVGFALRNGGNAPTVVRLRATGSNGIAAGLIDSAVIRLGPGAERIVRAAVATSADLENEIRHRVTVTATVEGTSTAIAASTLVEIVPRRLGASARFRNLPAELTLRGGNEANSYSAELRGGGLLGASSQTRAAFLFRGPNPSGSFLGQQDEFRASLLAPRYSLDLGDQMAFGSVLTETGRATFGASGAVNVGALELNGYSRRDRRLFDVTKEQQHGGSADLWVLPRLRLGASAFTRGGLDAADGATARLMVSGVAGTALRAELARTTNRAGEGNAYTASLAGSYPRLTYDVRREVADSGFANYWRGAATTYGSLYLRPFSRFVVSTRLNDHRVNRIASLPFSLDRSVRSTEGGIAFGRLGGVTLRAGHEEGVTFAPGPERDSRSRMAFIGVPIAGAYFRLEGETGASRYLGIPGDLPFQRVSLSANGGIGRQRFSANVQKVTGIAPFTVSAQDRLSAAGSLSLQVGPATRINLEVNTLRYAQPSPATFTTIDLGLGRQLGAGRRAILRSRALAYSPGAPTQRSMQNLEYTTPIGIPIGLSPDNAVVDVDVIDDASGKPASGVLLRLGNEARITDGNGHARFTGLGEGEYYLEPDRESMPAGTMVMPATPLAVPMRSGEKRRVELRIMRSVRIDGQVSRQEWRRPRIDGPDTLVDVGPAFNVVIGMANGDTVRTPVDVNGRFTFNDLHPGRWTLFVVAADVPAQHHFDRERVPLDLVPGSPQTIDLKIVPERQVVRFQAPTEIPVIVGGVRSESGVPARHSYTVGGPGETLTSIAAAMYNDRSLWPKIWLANPAQLPTPESVRIGQRLVVPDSAPLTPAEIAARDRYLSERSIPLAARRPVADTSWRPPVVTRFYTVSRGDGLMSIARVVYDDASLWPKIWYANLDQLAAPEQIRTGLRLRIPDKAPLTSAEIALRDGSRRRP